MKLYQLSDEELAEKVANHVLQYRGISESTRLLEELLKRFLQLQILAEDE
tara:strand:- start:758 stop:907 length:150 start_codon:yes stop_codon:yes gene_type:complete